MSGNSVQRNWEKFGAEDPYYAVLTEERYRKANLSDEHKEAFFKSGQDHVSMVLRTVRRHIDPAFTPRNALDFGCGVGRVLIPLAAISRWVTGIDTSPSMLNEAKRNCQAMAIENVTFALSGDELPDFPTPFDFIHSFIVFQHIPVRRGEAILGKLFSCLTDGGIFAAHFTYARKYKINALVSVIKDRVPMAANFIKWIKREGFFSPHMQMNPYNMNRIFAIIQAHHVKDFFAEYTNHGGELGLILYFRKP